MLPCDPTALVSRALTPLLSGVIFGSTILSVNASPIERRFEVSPLTLNNISVADTRSSNSSIEFCRPINESGPIPIDWSFLNISYQCNETERRPFDLREFEDRRTRLVKQLKVDGQGEGWGVWLDELSADSVYYMNVTQSEFRTWTQPYVFAISPASKRSDKATISWLIPAADLSRVRSGARLSVKNNAKDIEFVTYTPYKNPYDVMVRHLNKLRKDYGDKDRGWTAHFAGMKTSTANGFYLAFGVAGHGPIRPQQVSQAIMDLRAVKSAQEVAIMRCANRVTIRALRAVRERLVIGMTERGAMNMANEALSATGMYDIRSRRVLFGGHAGQPYGRYYRSPRLEEGHFALFQVGGTYREYKTDITRTMLPDLESGLRKYPNKQQEQAWQAVLNAQNRGLVALAMNYSLSIADLDFATRSVINSAGFGKDFTTRAGQGIGLEPDETPAILPYNYARLLNNVTFTLEPAIYTKDFGIKLGDPVLKTENGFELVSGEPLAQSPWEP